MQLPTGTFAKPKGESALLVLAHLRPLPCSFGPPCSSAADAAAAGGSIDERVARLEATVAELVKTVAKVGCGHSCLLPACSPALASIVQLSK